MKRERLPKRRGPLPSKLRKETKSPFCLGCKCYEACPVSHIQSVDMYAWHVANQIIDFGFTRGRCPNTIILSAAKIFAAVAVQVPYRVQLMREDEDFPKELATALDPCTSLANLYEEMQDLILAELDHCLTQTDIPGSQK